MARFSAGPVIRMGVEGLFVLPAMEPGGVQALVEEVVASFAEEGYRRVFVVYLADGRVEIGLWKDWRLGSVFLRVWGEVGDGL